MSATLQTMSLYPLTCTVIQALSLSLPYFSVDFLLYRWSKAGCANQDKARVYRWTLITISITRLHARVLKRKWECPIVVKCLKQLLYRTSSWPFTVYVCTVMVDSVIIVKGRELVQQLFHTLHYSSTPRRRYYILCTPAITHNNIIQPCRHCVCTVMFDTFVTSLRVLSRVDTQPVERYTADDLPLPTHFRPLSTPIVSRDSL